MDGKVDGTDRRRRARGAIVEVAAQLMREHGSGAVTTRGVADAAGVQAPTIYRLFGDKDGLLDAVAEHVLATYVASGSDVAEAEGAADADPLAGLRAGWDTHVGFGLANPAVFGLLNDPDRPSPAAAAGSALLRSRVHRVALTGRLRVSEARAVSMLHACGTGTVLTLLALPPSERDPGLADAVYEALERTILSDGGSSAAEGDDVLRAAVALRAAATGQTALTPAERALLSEWLDRIVADGGA